MTFYSVRIAILAAAATAQFVACTACAKKLVYFEEIYLSVIFGERI